jgi:putative N6-adenine-specific DNA methylase
MNTADTFEIFLVSTPGLEAGLLAEAASLNFNNPIKISGGVVVTGGWPEVWRANLQLRSATRVLARIGAFHAVHLSQLDKKARQFPWLQFLRKDIAVSVEATCKKSKIYHAGAVTQRIETALREEAGVTIDPSAELCIKVRFQNDLCTISIDTSGNSLHKRGHKEAIGKAPMRETLATHFLRACGYTGQETVVDPMCGSGTFIIEAAEIALGLFPGRTRHFAFEDLAGFDLSAWQALQRAAPAATTAFKFYGSDRDEGAIAMSRANAVRAQVADVTAFTQHSISDLQPPPGPPGLVIVNPPYGTRIGDKRPLHDLYAALGQVLMQRFKGWRVGLITADVALAKSTRLPFHPSPQNVNHGGLKVWLFQSRELR